MHHEINGIHVRIFGIVKGIIIVTAFSAASQVRANLTPLLYMIQNSEYGSELTRVGIRVSHAEQIRLPEK